MSKKVYIYWGIVIIGLMLGAYYLVIFLFNSALFVRDSIDTDGQKVHIVEDIYYSSSTSNLLKGNQMGGIVLFKGEAKKIYLNDSLLVLLTINDEFVFNYLKNKTIKMSIISIHLNQMKLKYSK